MALFDNNAANTMILTGLGLMGPSPFAGAQRGLMLGAQLGRERAAERRAIAAEERAQADFDRDEQRRQNMINFWTGGEGLMGPGTQNAPGTQYAQAGQPTQPGGPISLIGPGGPGAASVPAANPILAQLGMDQQQASNFAAMGPDTLPLAKMMMAQRERQAKLNAPPTGMRRMPDGSWAYDPNYLQGQEALKRAGRASTTNIVNAGPSGIDYGKPPKDYAWARDAQGNVLLQDAGNGQMAPVAVPVIGGPAAQEIAAEEEAAAAAQEQEQRGADLMLDEIQRSLDLVEGSGLPTTGSIGGLLSNLPETDAGALRNRLQTIRANIGFDRLQRMREASPTGGALGNVTEGELARLEAVMGSLEQSQRREDFLYNLRRLQDTYLDTIHGPGNRPDAPAEQPSGGNQFQDMGPDDLLSVDPSTITTDEALERYEQALRAQGLI